MKDSTILQIVAIICITILEIVNIIFAKIDGTILSGIVGAIVFIATKKYYEKKLMRIWRYED